MGRYLALFIQGKELVLHCLGHFRRRNHSQHTNHRAIVQDEILRRGIAPCTTGESNSQESSSEVEATERTIEDLAPNRIKDQINTSPKRQLIDAFNEVFTTTVDDSIRAKPDALFTFLLAAGHSDNTTTQRLPNLYGRRTRSTRSTVYQKCLARFHLTPNHQRHIRCSIRDVEYGGFSIRHFLGDGKYILVIDKRFFSKTAVTFNKCSHPHHTLPHVECVISIGIGDDATHFLANGKRVLRLEWIIALTQQDVG